MLATTIQHWVLDPLWETSSQRKMIVGTSQLYKHLEKNEHSILKLHHSDSRHLRPGQIRQAPSVLILGT